MTYYEAYSACKDVEEIKKLAMHDTKNSSFLRK